MASHGQQDPRNPPSPPQSIPLQDLARPPDYRDREEGQRGHTRGRTLLGGSPRPQSGTNYGVRYERLEDNSPSPADRRSLPPLRPPPHSQPEVEDETHSPIENPAAFQAAMGFAGLSMSGSSLLSPPVISGIVPLDDISPSQMSPYSHSYHESNDAYIQHMDSDNLPLTDPSYLQPIAGAYAPSASQSHGRDSFQSVRFSNPDSKLRGSRLGDDLPATLEAGYGRSRGHSFGQSLSPNDRRRSRSPSMSESPLTRAGSIMRAMSQRVVNLGNEPEPPELMFRRQTSEEPRLDDGSPTRFSTQDTSYHPERMSNPPEKHPPPMFQEPHPIPPREPWPITNPFRGYSMGIFSPTNPIRMKLCDLLVHPITEIAILVLIIGQVVLLTVESSRDDWASPRPHIWGDSNIDYAILGLFVVFTMELVARIIVSGFFFNAPEYSTINRKEGIKGAISQKYRKVFGPQRQASVRRAREPDTSVFAKSFGRSFTVMQKTNDELPTSVEEFQRTQLARRAFLRHSLNRIDLIAVVSFWIAFVLGITGIEARTHLYIFRMLSCLRILRLLYITSGTMIILKSLKKAAPLLVNVSFLIGFFWLLFAIIGVQAFKSSFSRSCVWIDPLGQANYTNNFTLCGGHLDNQTGTELPWIYDNGTNGAFEHKGYLCPRGSLCIESESLYNGTVSFDNIVNSLELVFIVMSANTFTDLMYYTTNSDYLAAALFFAGGIVIMMLWLTNLLIAVITSSFQVIREESKASAFTAEQQPPIHLLDQDDSRRHVTSLKYLYDMSSWIWIVIIAYGLLCQALRSATMSTFRTNFINYSEVVVTLLLDVEIIIRFAGDWHKFHKKNRNLMDAGLAIITTIILLPPIHLRGQAYAWLTVFQIIRAYRVVWAVPMTRELIEKVLGNAAGIGNLVLFVFLITFLIAILAVQLFRGDIPPFDNGGSVIHITFFSVYNAFLGMYQILSSENWTILLYNVTAYNDARNTGWIGAAFLIGWFILSFFILVNMFIAVIQENFDVSEDEKRLQQVKAFLQKKEEGSSSSNLALSTIFRLGRSGKTKDPLDYGQAAMEMLLKETVVREFLDEDIDPLQQTPTMDTLIETTPEVQPGSLSAVWGRLRSRIWSNREPNPFYSTMHFTGPNDTLDPRAMAREAVTAQVQRKKAQRDYLAHNPRYNTSLFIFKPSNRIRHFCQKIVGPGRGSERFEGVEPNKVVWYVFSVFIYLAVVAMVLIACVTTPLYQKEFFENRNFSIKNWPVWTDLAFAGVFTIEAVIKIVADGCFFTPNAYFRSLWGFVDGLVLVTLWINVITSFLNDGAVSRAVGAFKALRALRLLNVSDSARDTFHGLIFVAGWRVISAAFVSMSLLIPFAIYGINLFNGKMEICNDITGDINFLTDCVGEWASTPFSNNWNITAPRTVSNPYYDFDNFGGALFILFQIVSQEGWIDVMWSAESITGRGLQPQNFASQGNAIFFVIFNLMATVFVLTLFISVFMRTYTEQTGVAFLTAEQRSWMELRKLLRQVAPSKRPSNKRTSKLKNWCYKRAVQKHGYWHRAVTVVLVLHLILLMLEYYPEPSRWARTRDFIFIAFTLFYVINVVVRIIGLSWIRFRRSSWDVFALFAVSGTCVSTILLFSNYNARTTAFPRLHKLFLVSIVLLLIPRNNALDQLFKTAAASLTSIGNLLATWFVLFLVYAIAMTQTFGLTRFGSQGTNNLNFRTVPKALIVLFRMSVGEGWNQIMEDYATIQPPFCVEGSTFFESDCGSPSWARVLFISWNILSMYIFVSLFVSLIYESFSYVYQRTSGLSIVTREETRRFKQAWATFDPLGTGYISKENFPRLLGELSGVFAMRIYNEEDSIHRILEDCRLQAPGNRAISIASASQATNIDLKALNERVAKIDGKKARAARYRYNLFYEEVMVSADPDRGISFNNVLMTLAHYNVISDSKSLKLDEFLRRRARLQRVEEEARRRIVVGFFDTMFWHRRFRRHMDRLKSARMTDIPQFGVPEIIVDDEDNGGPSRQMGASVSPLLSPADNSGHPRDSFREAFGIDGESYRQEFASAVSSPQRSPNLTPHHHPTNSGISGLSFDLHEPAQAQHSREGSGVSAENVLEVFSESAWGESLRRSFTMRRSRGGSS